MTQRQAAIRRIESSSNVNKKSELIAAIVTANAFATVGISHLTTSRRHLNERPLQAKKQGDGWSLNGFSPWITGSNHASWLVIGGVEQIDYEKRIAISRTDDSTKQSTHPSEFLFAIPKGRFGMTVEEAMELMALSASSTGMVRFDDVFVDESEVLHGPTPNVMAASGAAGGAGGLQTSALALGHAAQAIEYIADQSIERVDLKGVANSLQSHWNASFDELILMAHGNSSQNPAILRKESNDLALNSTQAALVASKGAGFSNDHRVGRWCREAMFFLVWSCPQSVAQSHLCSFTS